VNNIDLTGRLVSDPTGKDLPEGGYVCELRLAVDGMGRGGRDETGYIAVHSFGESGKAAARVLSQGWLVAVSGRLQHETWEQDGQKRGTYRVIGHVEFLAPPRASRDHAGDGEAQQEAQAA
jgi:single stranded DNA-binding protein